VLPVPGQWTAVVGASSQDALEATEVRWVARTDPSAKDTVFHVKAFNASFASQSQIQTLLGELAARFQSEHGLELVIEPVTTVDPKYSAVAQDFLAHGTAALMAMGDPTTLNVFLVDQIIGKGGLLGLSSGIPASHGVAGPFNG